MNLTVFLLCTRSSLSSIAIPIWKSRKCKNTELTKNYKAKQNASLLPWSAQKVMNAANIKPSSLEACIICNSGTDQLCYILGLVSRPIVLVFWPNNLSRIVANVPKNQLTRTTIFSSF